MSKMAIKGRGRRLEHNIQSEEHSAGIVLESYTAEMSASCSVVL